MRAVILLLCLLGCSGGGGDGFPATETPVPLENIEKSGVRLNCAYESFIVCLALSQRYKTEIVYGKYNPSTAHVQCRAKINGRWEWIDNPKIFVTVGQWDGHIEDRTYTNDQVYEFLASGLWK